MAQKNLPQRPSNLEAFKEGDSMRDHTTSVTFAQKREEIHVLLSKASDTKKAEKAYGLALKYGIHEPWRALCGYKLAHMLLAESNDEKLLVKAEHLFESAIGTRFLGPWPALFRLAAMERRGCKRRNSFKKAFMTARDALMEYRRRLSTEGLIPDLVSQPGFQDMLKLAVAFLGPDLTSVPGRTAEDAIASNGWVLVGHDLKLAKIVRSKDFILQEIEALSESEKDAIFFKLSTKPLGANDTDPLLRHWRIGQRGWQVVPNYPALRLLALILSQKTTAVDGLISKLCGGDSSSQRNNFSQNKRRLRNEVEALLQLQGEKVFVSGRGQFPKINPTIKIYGAVEKKVL